MTLRALRALRVTLMLGLSPRAAGEGEEPCGRYRPLAALGVTFPVWS